MKRSFTCLVLVVLFIITGNSQDSKTMEDPDFQLFDSKTLIQKVKEEGKPWLPFFNGQNLLTGIYRLEVGQEDKQRPHDTDELYYVISGRSKFTVGADTRNIAEGDILFVKAHAVHRFHQIEEELVLFVIFDQ